MSTATTPFAVPTPMASELIRVMDYWKGLLRGDATMPFWDDVKLGSLPDLVDRLILIDAFDSPQRFRLNTIGRAIAAQYGANVIGKFIDEIDIKAPFEYLTAQASATIEGRGPTFYASGSSQGSSYARLLLPMWGNGRIEMMLGAIVAG
jgi:hypothetical protein